MSPYRITPGPGVRGYENFRQKTVQRFESTTTQTRNHCIGRNAAVAEVFCYLSLLRNTGTIPDSAIVSAPGAIVSASGAKFQSVRGSSNHPAAHCLPCQILINGQNPSMLATNSSTALAIRTLFGKCTLLPLSFNHADSAAEGNGLIETFVRACKTVLQSPTRAGRHISREKVRAVYTEVWYLGARQAYTTAIIQKQSIHMPLPQVQRGVGTDYGLIDLARLEKQREAVTREQEHVAEVVWVLKKYIENLSSSPSVLLDYKMSEMERLF